MLYAALLTDTQNTLKYHLVTVKPYPSLSKRSTVCTKQHSTYRKEIGKVRYVTQMLHDYHVHNGVSHCVKNGSYSSLHLE